MCTGREGKVSFTGWLIAKGGGGGGGRELDGWSFSGFEGSFRRTGTDDGPLGLLAKNSTITRRARVDALAEIGLLGQ